MTITEDSMLAQAQHLLRTGAWEQLALLEDDALPLQPERGPLAAFAAVGQLHAGNFDAARRLLRQALAWGCPHQLASRLCITAVHVTLGRAAMLCNDQARALRHFESSVAVSTPDAEGMMRVHHRAIQESVQMGLLAEAGTLLNAEMAQLQRTPLVHPLQMQLFKTELELLTSELSLAHQRRQLRFAEQDLSVLAPLAPLESMQSGQSGPSGPSREAREALVQKLIKLSPSQLGQDVWVLEKTDFKRGGFFVEFGATDGVLLSNTYMLEKSFGWKGICAEPNPQFFELLRKNRHCQVSNQYIGARTGEEVTFIAASAYGGAETHADMDKHANRRETFRAMGHVLTMTSISLHDFLLEHNAPQTIDYMSIDTEGSELDILAAFPFDKWDVRFLTVEHNFTDRRKDIQALLKKHGYRQYEMKWDDYFEKTDPAPSA